MSGLLLNLILIVALLAPFAVRRNQPPLANDDQRVLLFQPAAIVEIPVLDNDVDADGNALHVVELSTVEGGRAELVEGALVRVYPDWSRGAWNISGQRRRSGAPGALDCLVLAGHAAISFYPVDRSRPTDFGSRRSTQLGAVSG